jgi:hypothetical protein
VGDLLRLAVSSEFHMRRLTDRQDEIAALCERFFGTPMRVEVICEAADELPDSTQPQASPNGQGDDRKRRHAALNHPKVNLVLKELQGEIIEIRLVDTSAGESG